MNKTDHALAIAIFLEENLGMVYDYYNTRPLTANVRRIKTVADLLDQLEVADLGNFNIDEIEKAIALLRQKRKFDAKLEAKAYRIANPLPPAHEMAANVVVNLTGATKRRIKKIRQTKQYKNFCESLSGTPKPTRRGWQRSH